MPDLRVLDVEPVDAAVVEYLEHVLKRARRGDFSSVAIAAVARDGSTYSGFSTAHNLGALTGAVAGLQGKLVRELISG